MFKLLRRGLAYFIDMMVVLFIVQTISGIGFINKNLDNYNKTMDKYMEEFGDYSEFIGDITEYYEDKKITSEEYEELVEENSLYKELVDKYYNDGELTSKNYNKLVDEANDIYMESTSKIYKKIDKYSIVYNITYIIVTLLYFVLFNIITGGATLGKKLVRLKIVNNKDRDKKVNVGSYIIRWVMLYQVVYYLFKIIFVYFLSTNSYFEVANVVYDIHSYLTMAILVFVMVRMDNRGLHDMLSNTIVVNVDKNGNEIVQDVKMEEVVEEAEIVEEKENASEEEVKKEGIVKEKKKTNSSKKVKISTKDEDKKTTKKVK